MPVPANNHLTFVEVRDFTPGLWESGDWLIPAGGAQVLTDAYPQPGGGLRAFFKPGDLATTGIALGAGARIIGLFAYGTNHRSNGTLATDYYCVTYSDGDRVPRIYRFDTTDAAQTQWSLITSLTAAPTGSGPPKAADFLAYVLTDGTVKIVVSIGYNHADSGVYTANQATLTGTQVFAKIAGTLGLGPIAVHQSRLLEGRKSKVHFTNPGTETFSGFVDVEPQQVLSENKALIPRAPGDLLIGKEGASWTAIQGDLTDPIVRAMSSAHYLGHPDQVVADTGQGVAFQEPAGGIFLTESGYSFGRMDEQLAPAPALNHDTLAVTQGVLLFHHNWLIAPRGYVWDQRTKAWFKTSFLADSPAYIQTVDRFRDLLLAVRADKTIKSYTLDEQAGARASSFQWKSPPLRHPEGRQIEVREVQVISKSYAATSTITVTVNGVARAVAVPEGRQHTAFLFRTRAESLDVTVDSSSGGTAEAPSIEAVRIGYRGGHLVP